MEVVAGFFCVWVKRKFLGLDSGGKKISGFVFKFVGWVCVYVCWLGLCLCLLAGFDRWRWWLDFSVFGYRENF